MTGRFSIGSSRFHHKPNFRSAVRPIRLEIDELYRELHQLCDVLEGGNECSRDPSPHGLLLSESNELLDGLKMLFRNGSDQDQVRLMTIAPKTWSCQKLKSGRFYIFDANCWTSEISLVCSR